jgi:histidinol-phosphate aminotransferase
VFYHIKALRLYPELLRWEISGCNIKATNENCSNFLTFYIVRGYKLIVKIETRKQIGNIGAYVPGKPIEEVQRELGLTKIIKMASNENPYGFSPLAEQAMIQEMRNTNFYPEVTAPKLAEKLANRLGIKKERLIFGNGSDEVIRLLTRTYISEKEEAIMADVTFPQYKTNVLIEGGTPIIVPLVNGVHDLEAMLSAINERTKMVFVCNPNNPTGTTVGKERLLSFIEKIPSHILVILDEAYYEYVTSEDHLETVPLLDRFSNLVILRTFSKMYGLAALRIGYGMMHSSIVQELMRIKEPFNTNRIAQAAALASLEDHEFPTLCRRKNEEGRQYFESKFDDMGLRYFPSQTNFMMVHLDHSGNEVFEALLKQGIIVRSGGLLGYPETIRVTIGTEEENEAFITALKQVLASERSEND